MPGYGFHPRLYKKYDMRKSMKLLSVMIAGIPLMLIGQTGCGGRKLLHDSGKEHAYELPQAGKAHADYMQFYSDGTHDYIAILTNRDYTLRLYTYPGDQLYRSVKLILLDNNEQDGEPDSAGFIHIKPRISGFCIRSMDSIFFLTEHSNSLYMVDSNGVLKRKWEIGDYEQTGYDVAAFKNDPFLVAGNDVFFTKTSFLDYRVYPYKTHVLSYNIKGDSVGHDFADFPSNYKQDKWWHIVGYSFGKTINKNKEIVISYPTNDSLFVYQDGRLRKRVPGKSPSLGSGDFPPFDNAYRGNTEYTIKYANTLGSYSTIVYDPYRDCYYRLVLHAQSFTNKDGSTNFYEDRPWSLQIFDADLRLIGEQDFPPRRYAFGDLLVVKDGLLIGNLHPDKTAKQSLSFTLFTLKRS